LAAFRLAWQQGAQAIEADCHLTRDGQIVCIHDDTALRTGGCDLRIADATYAELRRLDVGSWKGSRWAGERMPTLAEVLATVPSGKQVFIEIKARPAVLDPLARVLRESGLRSEQTVIISFDAGVLAKVRERFSGVKTLWVTDLQVEPESGTLTPSADAILATLRDIGVDGVDCRADPALDAAFVEVFRRAGMEFHVWHDGVLPNPEPFAALGVDSITHNRPPRPGRDSAN
jgi:glycerophosphoryl diester phosphodiesterase